MDESDRVSLVTAIFFAVLSIPLALFLSYAGYKTFSQRWPHMKVLWSLFALSIICEALGMVVVSTQPATSLPNAIGWAGEALSYVGELMLGVWSTWFCILGVLYRAGRSTATSGQPTRRDVTLLAVLIAVFIAVGLAQVTIAVGGLALGLRTGVIAVPVAFAIAFLVLHRTLRWRRDSVPEMTRRDSRCTTTVSIGGVEEVSTSGATTTTTTTYMAGGQRIAEAVNGTFTSLGSDGLGSALVALNASGTPTASVLYTPSGAARYSSGSMPGSYGCTGQHSDAATTGLDYYNARYYDPVAGQFASADTVADGLNRYASVRGNPETLTDPSGHRPIWCDPGDSCTGGGTSGTGAGSGSGGGNGTGGSTGGGSGAGGGGTSSSDSGGTLDTLYQAYHSDPDPAQIQRAWVRYLSRQMLAANETQDITNLVIDVALMITDIGMGAAGVALAWVSALTDLTQVGSDITQLVIDDSKLKGNAANAQSARRWGAFASSLSVIANVINIIVQGTAFFLDPLEGLAKEGAAKLKLLIASRLFGMGGSAKKINTAWGNMSADDLQAQLYDVEHMSPDQLKQLPLPPQSE